MAAAGGPAYAAAYDRTGADARGITAAFLYRTDRLSLAGRDGGRPAAGLGTDRAVPRSGAAGQRRRAEPEGAQRGAAGRRGHLDRPGRQQRLHPGPQLGRFTVRRVTRLDRAVHPVRAEQPLLVRPGRPGRAASGAGGVRRGDRHRDRGGRPERPGGLRRRPERVPPPGRPDRRPEPGPAHAVGPARPAVRGRPAQPVGQPGRGRAGVGVLVQLPGAGADARPPVRQRRALR